MEEKEERDFSRFVKRTSNYKALKVLNCTRDKINMIVLVIVPQEAKKHQLSVLDASRRSSVAIG